MVRPSGWNRLSEVGAFPADHTIGFGEIACNGQDSGRRNRSKRYVDMTDSKGRNTFQVNRRRRRVMLCRQFLFIKHGAGGRGSRRFSDGDEILHPFAIMRWCSFHWLGRRSYFLKPFLQLGEPGLHLGPSWEWAITKHLALCFVFGRNDRQ